ncbi:DUF2851 family protein [Frigoriflavimonas asaccharolytica]|uniref:6-pyruvoyl-tetrahydropterin synthase n=1 Tax=Frigoriflavimonas asaccharolytica TaxID=2735899 RepID=A0A8J8GCE7_9FLAO|nr:DUF2851 family protein [Frigoriflavimonas asaccharolytica]NRS93659.1 6-pyruvoyl-tetrahydropterin synthase [Frigoriflavimonas asaccharolytica]
MNEHLLQYLWNYKVFTNFPFYDTDGNLVEILDFGKWNKNSGPDFLFAKIKINDVTLAGNIELHVKSSDWIFHQHEGNPEFENLILHVVYQDDIEIAEFKQKNIPTLELKDYIDESLIGKYASLCTENQFIPCEKIFTKSAIPFQFEEENLLRKLDEKSLEIESQLSKNNNDYEAVLFQNLAYAFGLKVNAEIFQQIAESLDFKIINKIKNNKTQLEALLYGVSSWLENPEDEEMKIWKREFDFLKTKYQLNLHAFHPKFSRLRPPSFPTIRWSQLVDLYHKNASLFSKIIDAKNTEELYAIFSKVKASEYWDNHFNFGKISSVENEKIMTQDFIDLIIINTILPLKYTYHKNFEENIAEDILKFYSNISAEKNTIISSWKNLGVKMSSSLETQAYLYHYKNFCLKKDCLNCSIGFKLLQIN